MKTAAKGYVHMDSYILDKDVTKTYQVNKNRESELVLAVRDAGVLSRS